MILPSYRLSLNMRQNDRGGLSISTRQIYTCINHQKKETYKFITQKRYETSFCFPVHSRLLRSWATTNQSARVELTTLYKLTSRYTHAEHEPNLNFGIS